MDRAVPRRGRSWVLAAVLLLGIGVMLAAGVAGFPTLWQQYDLWVHGPATDPAAAPATTEVQTPPGTEAKSAPPVGQPPTGTLPDPPEKTVPPDANPGPTPVQQSDFPYFASDFKAALVLHPLRIGKSPLLAEEVRKDLAGILEKLFGVDPLRIERLTLLVEPLPHGLPKPDAKGDDQDSYALAAIIQLTQGADAQALPTRMLVEPEEAVVQGRRYFKGRPTNKQDAPPCVHVAGDRTILCAPEPTLHKMLAAGAARSALADRLRQTDLNHDLVAVGVLDAEPLRQFLNDLAKTAQGELPPELAAAGTLPERVRAAAATLNLTDDTILKVTLEGKEPDDAKALHDLLARAVDTVRKQYAALRPELLKQLLQSLSPEASASLLTAGDQLVNGMRVGRTGDSVALTVARPQELPTLSAKLTAALNEKGPPRAVIVGGGGESDALVKITPEMKKAAEAIKQLGGNVSYRDFRLPAGVRAWDVNVDLNAVQDLNAQLEKVRPHLAAFPDIYLQVPGLTDAGIAHLKGLGNVLHLQANQAEVTDEGVAVVATLPQVRRLDLLSRKITDASYVHLAGLTHLERFDFLVETVSDASLAHLRKLTKLQMLNVASGKGKSVTDAGLAHLKDLTEMRELELAYLDITDAGLASLAGMTKLERLQCYGLKKITGAGFGHLKGCSGLAQLTLGECEGLDLAGAKHIAHWKSLEEVRLGDGFPDEAYSVFAELPRLKTLEIFEDTKFSDAALRNLGVAAQLPRINFPAKLITDAGLTGLKGMTRLQALELQDSQVTDAGLGQLAAMPALLYLSLDGRPITDAGLANLKGAPALTRLQLANTRITNAGLVHLQTMPKLQFLILDNTAITDDGLAHLKKMDKLMLIQLRGTKVTPAGIADLKTTLPKAGIFGDDP